MSMPISVLTNKPSNPQVGMADLPSYISTDPLDAVNDLPVGPSGLPADNQTIYDSWISTIQNTNVSQMSTWFTQFQTFIEDNPGIALAVGGLILFMGLGGLTGGGSGGRRRR